MFIIITLLFCCMNALPLSIYNEYNDKVCGCSKCLNNNNRLYLRHFLHNK